MKQITEEEKEAIDEVAGGIDCERLSAALNLTLCAKFEAPRLERIAREVLAQAIKTGKTVQVSPFVAWKDIQHLRLATVIGGYESLIAEQVENNEDL